jgi:hypothetical protein
MFPAALASCRGLRRLGLLVRGSGSGAVQAAWTPERPEAKVIGSVQGLKSKVPSPKPQVRSQETGDRRQKSDARTQRRPESSCAWSCEGMKKEEGRMQKGGARSPKVTTSQVQATCRPCASQLHGGCALVYLLSSSCLALVLLLFSSCFPRGLRRHPVSRPRGATEPTPFFDSTGWAVIQKDSHFTFYICQPVSAAVEWRA